MKTTGQKLILLSFILAIIATIVIFLYLQSLSAPKQAPKKTVLVAAENIPSRTLIDKKMIKEIQVTDDTLFADCLKSSSEIIGKYSKETIMKNEGFRKEMLLDKNSDELSIKLENGNRAVSINATGASGVSDLLKPGDFVDIVVYLTEKKDKETVVRPEIARMILQNIQVLAVNKQLDRDDKTNTSDNQKNATSFLITLSIKASDVEKLALAENVGSLKLALRPIKDASAIDTDGATGEELLIDSTGSGTGSNTSSSANTGSGGYTSYTVKHGDTLKKISKQFYGDESKYTILKEANGIKDADLIITGEVIRIPTLAQ